MAAEAAKAAHNTSLAEVNIQLDKIDITKAQQAYAEKRDAFKEAENRRLAVQAAAQLKERMAILKAGEAGADQ